jgi:amino acid adenylation domain-containing protein
MQEMNGPDRLEALKRAVKLKRLQERGAAVRTASEQSAIEPADRGAPLPLSWAQQRLWFLDRLDAAAGDAYHMPAALRLDGSLDLPALRATLDRIVARHENLRTTFVMHEGLPVQRIAAPDAGFELAELACEDGQVEALGVAFFAQAFDLAQGPLVRGQLLKLAPDQHVLLINQHHIISDGWSIGVLVREVSALYAAFSQGQPDPLAPLAVQYADYAAWQRAWLQGDALHQQADYWKRRLAGAPELLALPADRPRPAVQSHAGASLAFTLDAGLSAGLKQLGQRHGATLFMTLLAGWGILMSRMSGQEDVVIGTPVANRQRREVEALIGFFVNALALRISTAGAPSVAELLAQVKQDTLDAYTHQDIPFEQVVETVSPQRSLAHSPLFQTMITVDSSAAQRRLALPGLTLTELGQGHGASHFDTALTVVDDAAELAVTLTYATALYDEAGMRRLLRRFESLLRGMVADDAQAIARLDLLVDDERELVTHRFNATARPYPRNQTIHGRFAAEAARRPDAIALVCGSERLSYAELEQRADALAQRLLAGGVQPGALVAVCAERGAGLITALLAILKAGAAYVPLDPGHPDERLAFMLADSRPAMLLTDSAQQGRFDAALPLLCLDLACDDARPHVALPAASATDLAYVIYTSGSTGQPKGVMVSHRNVLQLVLDEPCVRIGDDDCVAYCANPAFDASTWEIWGALLNGAQLLVVDQATLLEPAAFGALLRRENATIVQLTAGLFRQYAGAMAEAWRGLNYLLFGGDRSDLHTIASVWAHARPRHLVHTYGPTETVAFATTHEVSEATLAVGVLPIGRPIANTQVYILDGTLQPVPPGATGELYIGGDGVAHGYLNRPELTEARFVPNPFGEGQLYKTGDLGRWLADGNIEFLGRNDFQVKIRGFRIELGEIEARLAACPGVKEALVLARADGGGEKRLVAYLTGTPPAAAELRAALAVHLADYMLPAAFVSLDAFPLTANGKVDRDALPAPDALALASRPFEAPAGEVESAIAAIWQGLLKVDQVGRHDHFFELGGHSLLAVQLMSRLRDAYGIDVPLRTLFAHPDLAGFTAQLAEARQSTLGAIEPADRAAPLPLSWAQQRLWFLDRLDAAAGAAYRMPAALRLDGSLDVNALRATLDRIVARHENLRTTFVMDGDTAVQRIAAPDTGFALELIDLSDELQALDTAMEAFFRQPFDLAQGPLIRGQLLRLAPEQHILLINQHHIISDGWSIGVLVGEVGALYAAFSQGQPDPLAPLSIQYADYAAWQRAWLQGEALQQQAGYWKQRLAGAPELLALPTDRPRPAVQSHAGASLAFTLDADLSAGLKQLGQRHGATLFMTLLAGWGILMSRMSGQEDVVIGTPVANRQRREIEALIGFFVNALALRISTAGAPSVAELLAQVKQDTLDAYAHQDIPFEQVVETVSPQRSLAHSPLFQTMLTVDSNAANRHLALPGLTLTGVEQDHGASHFDTALTVADGGAELTGTLTYATALYDDAGMRRLLRRFESLLRGMVADDAQAIARLDLLVDDERELVIRRFNATARPYPRNQTIHGRFAAEAARRPDAIALVCGSERLSYAELEQRANALARRLLAGGVQPGALVAVCAERGAGLVTAVLAILKAGAAYVPLDPGHPDERLAFMLADSRPAMLVTDSAQQDRFDAALPLLCLDQAGDATSRAALPVAGATDLAYVIYTSGSTGQPKGVMVSHRNVLQLVLDEPCVRIGDDDCVAYCANPAFDASTWEIWGALLNGAQLLVVDQATLLEPAAFGALLRRESATIVQLTAGLFRQYADVMAEAWRGLNYLLFGGDRSDLHTIASVWAHARPRHLVHTYGPTETVAFATTHEVSEATLAAGVLPIGRPIANTQVYILDTALQPVPPGATGELYIGGDGVAHGYLNRPELTEARFVPNPFGEGQLYKTGDLGRWLADGNIEYLGRNDFQVKIRGFRIELGEIEARLAACPGVKEALVLARADGGGEKRLVAYLTGTPPAAAELRAALAVHLADYMLPAAFVSLDAFPLTANGKVDRDALPEPDALALASRPFEAPEGEVESAIAAIWQGLLKVERIGRHDHFFELGGHSLLVIEFIQRLRRHAMSLEVRQVFMTPTLAELASAVVPLDSEATDAAPPNRIPAGASAITPDMLPLISLSQAEIDTLAARVEGGCANIQDIYPLAPLQEGILFHYLLEKEGDPYLSRTVLAFESRALLDRFLVALQQVIDRHDILRSAVFWDGLAQPLQVVCRQARLPVQELPAQPDALGELMRHTDPRQLRLDVTRAPLLAGWVIADTGSGEWLLSIVNQHMVSDHVALGYIIDEIRALLGDASGTLPRPIPFRDYIAHSRSISPERHRAYFESELGDLTAPSAPFELIDVAAADATIEQARVELEASLAARVRDSARDHGVVPAVLFHAAWAQVVSLCTGSDDVVFGTVLSGRTGGADGIGQVVGMFINTLPIRVSLCDVTAPELVAAVNRKLASLLVHEQASLALAQQCSGLAPGLPLFGSLLNYRHGQDPGAASAALKGMRALASEERSTYPISASVDDLAHGFALTLHAVGVAPDRMAGYFIHALDALIHALAAAPERPVQALDILPPDEATQLTQGIDAVTPRAPGQLVHGLFEAHAASRPHAIAVKHGDTVLDYDALNRRANRLAHQLIAAGAAPDTPIAVCTERGVSLVIAMLACLKAGGAYLPIDPTLPAERIAYMLEDSKPLAILTHSAASAALPDSTSEILRIDLDAAAGQDWPNTNPDGRAQGLTPAHLANIIYTSGSTGRPKGVMIEHRNVVHLATEGAYVPFNADSVVAQVSSPSFDAATFEIWGALLNGGSLVHIAQECLLSPRQLAQQLRADRIGVLLLTTSLFNRIAHEAPQCLASLDTLVFGGEAAAPDAVRKIAEQGMPARLVNAYGPTENTTVSTWFAVTPAYMETARIVPIGAALRGVSLFVLDRHGRLAPHGVIGELHLGGAGLARGYLNRPELTGERFVHTRFGRLYRTGDLVRWLADGTLEYIGRNDFQVKIRGFRIELGEIEMRLAQCSGVNEARVAAIDDAGGSKRLVAYLTGNPPTAAQLRETLAAHLPAYMVPAAFVTLERLPLNASGKLDRDALPLPDLEAIAVRPYEAPRGRNETVLAALWQELLQLERVGRHDDFFELGGHSLLAVQLMSRLRLSLGVEVQLRDLLARPVLADFAAALDGAGAAGVAAIPLAPRDAPLPASWAQQRLWFTDQLDHAASVMYHLPAVLPLSGTLDLASLRRTLDRIVARHESLRTRFAGVAGAPVQVIDRPDIGFSLLEHDLGHLDPATQEAHVDSLRRLEADTLFDLARGPLVRGRLLRLGAERHVLLITQHHIISDGWSIGLLVREVNALYGAFSKGLPDPLPPLPLQYADYAVWQRQRLDQAALRKQLDYWTSQLGDAPALLELPTDRPRPAMQDFAAGTLELTLPPALTASLRQLCRRHGCTLFMGLLAAWAVLLSRLSAQESVVIGSGVANRERAETEGLIGFFVNTLCFHVRVDEEGSVADLLDQVRVTALDAYALQELPFDHVVEALNPPRSMSHNAVFQSMLSMNETPTATSFDLGSLQVSEMRAELRTTPVDLSISLVDTGTEIRAALIYASALFDAATVARWGDCYLRLLAAMGADDTQPVRSLEMLGMADRRQLLEFNPAPRARSGPQLAHAMFEAVAAAQGDAVALELDGAEQSYAQLDRRANQIAHHLLALGVKPGDRVAVCVERNFHLIAALLGVLKAGACYVPLDPGYPEARLSWALSDSGAMVLLTEDALLDTLPALSLLRIVTLDTDRARDLRPGASPALAALTADDLAYLIYTSGSTGQPKGVMLAHGGLCNLAAWQLEQFGTGPSSRVLQFASPAFDASIWEIVMALCSGGRLVLAPREAREAGAPLAATLRNHGITHVTLPSAVVAAFGDATRLDPATCLIMAGDACPPELAARWAARVSVYNAYGPTETTVCATIHRCGTQLLSSVPIGRPIANTQVYILDKRLGQVPLGVAGEIYVGGAGVARGYLKRPELTDERFIANPFGAGFLYKTGDLGRWLPDGNIVFLGRNDFQLKVRGLRIEPGEIEARLVQCDGVDEAFVVGLDDGDGSTRLVAYLTGEPPSAAELRQALSRHLPDYMLPSAFVVLERLPLTANGKVDRKALPKPGMSALAARPYQAPQSAIEKAIAEDWQSLLQVPQVGLEDNFFELGGHSLLAVQLMSRIRQAHAIEVPLRTLFAHPTLAAFAARVGEADRSAAEAIMAADRDTALPLSLAQQRLWFLAQLDAAASHAYTIPLALRLDGALELAVLRATLDGIVARHENLRTCFVMDGDTAVQRIAAPDSGFALDLLDLSEDALDAAMAAFFGAPLDLAQGPLIRGQLLKLAPEQHVLLINQHHIISDGWSIGVLVREVGALYAAFSQGQPDPLAPLAIQYADYAAWQRAWLQGDALQQQAGYWKQHLAGAPELLALPTDRPRPAVQSHAGASVGFTLDAGLSAGLKQLGQRHGATLFMTLLTGWGILMSRMSGQEDVVIGTPVANRQRREIEALIGFFVNTLALRISTAGEPSVADVLEQVRQDTLDAYAHQDIPFEQVVETVSPQRSLAHSPLFQTMLSLNNTPVGEALTLPGLRLSGISQEVASTHFDTSLSLGEAGDVIAGQLTYATALFDQATMARLLGHFEAVLRAMVADEAQPVSSLNLLSGEQHARLTDGFNATERDFGAPALIHQLFEAQAAARPHATALHFEDAQLSYAELNRRANQLAHRLLGLGVQPGQRVALCVERSLEMAIGWLAILKAGAAYVPMEPTLPQERLAYMLADSGATAVLTHSSLAPALPPLSVPVLQLDTLQDDAVRADNPPVPGLDASGVAYVIYTSGSTGAAKGVMVEHGSAINFWQAMKETTHAGLADASRIALNASFAFDMSWKGWLQLLSGHPVYLIPQAIRADGERMLAFLERHRIDAFDSTPSQLDVLVRAGLLENPRYHPRSVLLGGEPIGQQMWDRLRAARHIAFFNMYGPTECTVDATIGRIEADDAQPHIGRPLANAQVYALDAHMAPVPLGVTGEIYIGGAGVARGYLNRPELTAERFVANPFGAGRLYKTGDIGRWRDDGKLEYLGRNDFQVKIRGYRIELGEIEARLRQCDGVRDAVVVAHEHDDGNKRLVAYLTGTPPDAAALRAALAARLADYMLPAAFVALDALPLTPNGKLDRKALPAPDALALATRPYVAAQGELETAVAAIWQDLLKIDRVGRHDHFFELGGHSLLAVQLTSRLRQQLGLEVPLRTVFAHPELAQFTAQLVQADVATLEAIPLADRSAPLPLSWMQQRLWFLDQLDAAASAAYHMPTVLRLSGALDRSALRATLDGIVARHEILRTTFPTLDGEPVQRIAPADCGLDLPEQDIGTDPDALTRLAAQFIAQPFDLATGPLIRGQLLRVADHEHVLLINQHHIISDGWSTGVLVKEVAALYSALSQGHANLLAPLPLQYADYAAWQRGWLTGAVLRQQLDYWQRTLAGAPALLAMPLDRPRPPTQDYAGANVDFSLTPETSKALAQLARRHGATIFMVLLAGWGLLLSRISGQGDVVIGTPVAGRQRSEVEQLIGYFVNTLALRVTGTPDMSVADLLNAVRGTTLGAYAHQDVPFEQVLEGVNPARSVSHNPLFQTMLAFNNTPPREALPMRGLQATAIAQSSTAAYCDLYLSMSDGADGLRGTLLYATALFDAATAQRLVGYFQTVLAGMAADDGGRIDRLPLVDAAERELQLHTWNRSEESYPLEHCFAGLFEARVALDPDAIAVSHGEEQLSYRELDQRASRLAQVLVDAGAGPEVLVTLACERNIVMLEMMLAVFKAGAAFLPLDIKHPPQRLREIVELSASSLMLVSEACLEPARALAPHAQVVVAERHHEGPDPAPRLGVRGTPGDLAYVIFTSGSTGKPKGAMVEQRGMLNHMFGKISTMGIQARDRLAQTASPAFDICVWQFLSALLVGGRTVILHDEIAFDPLALPAAVNRHGITLLQTVPSMLRSLLDGCGADTTLDGLRYLIPTGEALTTRLCRDWFARFPAIALMNVYGPAECSDDVTWHAIDASPAEDSVIPIGRPTPNNRIYILDRALQPVPVGTIGEICVAGTGVGRGYLNNPAQTEAAFVAHPFEPGQRFYRTGDLGRFRADGVIEFHGRLDFQVKIRGFRIELGEIEARLLQCEGVHEAVVLAREDGGGDKRLVAYLTGAPPAAAELRAALAVHLADYMLPAAFVVLDALPLTPNGKLDRKALPAPDALDLSSRPFEAPQGEVETALAAIWQNLLKIERVGRHDHFFELGGHSLLATQLVTRLRQSFDVDIALLKVFQQPVLAALAETVTNAVLNRFETHDIDLLSADIGDLTESEIDALLAQERALAAASMAGQED